MIPNVTYHCQSYRSILFPPSTRIQRLSVIAMLHLNVKPASLFFTWIFPNKFLCDVFAVLTSKNLHTFLYLTPGAKNVWSYNSVPPYAFLDPTGATLPLFFTTL